MKVREIGNEQLGESLGLAWEAFFAVCSAGSPYAVPIYHQLGFVETGGEQIADGMRFTPMKFERSLLAAGRA